MSTSALLDEMEKECKKWAEGTTFYGIVYRGVRIILIVTSATVAAEATLQNSVADFVVA